MDELILNILPILLILPLVGAAVCAFVRAESARAVALLFSLLCAVLGLLLLLNFNYGNPEPQFLRTFGGLSAIGFNLSLGVDAISLWLIALALFLQPLVIAASFAAIRDRQREYYGWMLGLLTAMLGVFMARDLLLFYVFFELTLVPMFFIIGIWGGPERRYAAGKFFLFTFAGSVFTLAAIIYLGLRAQSFDLGSAVEFARGGLTTREAFWVTMGFLAGFAVKVPLFPVHTWLPLAHTEAPTAGSVILAGVLLKLGTYGILRLALPIGLIHPGGTSPVLFPTLLTALAVLCIIGILYGALVAWVQKDIKKLVAYSSVSHLGFCVLGLAALNYEGIQGSILYMVNHGLSTGAMFLVIGMIYERFHTRDIDALSGLARRMPVMSAFFVFFVLSSIGLPGLNGFVSEFLTILGAFKSSHLGVGFGAVAALGVILGAVYMLHMTARVIFGPLKTPDVDHEAHASPADAAQAAAPGESPSVSSLPRDLSLREVSILVPIAIVAIVLGVAPSPLLRTLQPPVKLLIEAQDTAAPANSASAAISHSDILPNPLPWPRFDGSTHD